ncbi:MAG: efflux RND transporter periplasmic adaptor subunit, partial [Methylovulum sp.]|nr:efflux RND transporter periplasmic adaptor subunit [Methylovulum sp.]
DNRTAPAQIAKAEVAYEFAKKKLARKQLLNPGETISRKLIDDAQQLAETARTDLQTAQTQRALLTINAPLAGTVSAIHFKVGEAVSPSNVLADMLDLHRLEIVLHIPSPEAAALVLGQAVSIDTGNGKISASGTISFINPQIDVLTDTVLVRVELPSTCASDCLRSGQFIHARIVVETRRQRLAVPLLSVVTTGGDGPLLAIVDGDRAVQRPVVTGLRDGDMLEVSGEGLHAGMTVVTEGAYGLPPATRVKVLP